MSLPFLELDGRVIIAHRGASAEAPENILESFRLAVHQKCDAIECDVRLSKDGVPVLMHDSTLRRTTGDPREVRNLGLDELRRLDAGAQFAGPDDTRPYRHQGITIPTLQEVLRAFPNMPVLIEIKAAEAQDAVAELLRAEQAIERCVLASFKPNALVAFRGGPFVVSANRWEILTLYLRGRTRLPAPPHCPTYSIPDYWKGLVELPRPEVVALARRFGVPVYVWTVDDPDRARILMERGVSGLYTNRPAAIRTALNEAGFLR